MKRASEIATALLERCRAYRPDRLSALWEGVCLALSFRKIRHLPDRLTDLVGGLTASAGNEARFLAIGGTLQSIYTDTADLIQFIRQTIQSVMGDTDENILGRVTGLARRAETTLANHQERVAGSLAQIRDVADHLGGLHSACDQLGRIAMNLRVVGLNIGVESTRSVEGKEMFTVVSQEILQLSNAVNDIAVRIREDATAAMTEQITAFDTISGSLQILKGLTAEAGDVVRSAVDETDRCVTAFVTAFETADGRFQEISRRVGEIVMGIQFHDNMRQRVEHITSALESSARTFREGGAGTGEVPPEGDAPREKALGNACAMVRLQEAQLSDVVAEIDRVHRKSVDAFEEMGSEIRELAGIMSAVSAQEGPGASDPFSKLKDALTGLGNLLEKGDALGRRIEESISKATESSRRFSQHLEDVDRISFETKIKALNAIVKAGHMSEEGRTLEVLAQEMNRLSRQTNRFVDHVEDKLTQVGRFGNAEPAEPGGGQKTESERNLFDIAQVLTEGIDELVQVRSTMNLRAGEASERADALRGTVSRTVLELGFLTDLSKEMAGHGEALGAVTRTLSDASKKWRAEAVSGMEDLAGTYTMQRERAIHQGMLPGEGADSGPEPEAEIALWDDFEEPPREEAQEDAKDKSSGEEDNAEELGDNIELF